MSKKVAIIEETITSDVPTTGTGRTPEDALARYEKIVAAQKRWREANKDKVEGYQKKWRDANADKVKAAHKRYQEAHKDKVREWHKKSQLKQREMLREAKAILAQREAEAAANS